MSRCIQNKFAALLTSAMLLGGFANSVFAWDYGNGRHGSYVLTTNTTIEQLYQTVRLTNDPAQYNPADSNAIPNFQNLIITNGATLTANAWNGSSGGRIYIKVEATLLIAPGSSISVNGIGYRGGGQTYGIQFAEGIQGESYAGSPAGGSSANYGGGGGGGVYGTSNGNPIWFGAGGGGYGSGGASYYNSFYGTGGYGGGVYGTALIDTVYLGSGGGGNAYGYNGQTPNGGNGGGAIVLQAGNIRVAGQILANGGGAGGGGGGGGSGGSIVLRVAAATLGTNTITATGGSGNGGGNGGDGRIMISYAENYIGSTTPSAYTIFDKNSDNITVITNQPTTQTNFLAANVTFNVGVYGLPVLMFQWNFNGIPISGATNQILSLNNIALTNTGYYSVTISNAVMTITSSNAFLKVLDTAISFNDGIPNWWLEQYGLSTNDPTLATNYPPADHQLTYLEKYFYSMNPQTNDTDGDGISDYDELFVYHTNPLLASTAGDGIPDGWKVQYGLNPLIANANNEAGFDGVTYMQIYQYDLIHTNQLNPNQPFAVGPGLSNFEIINNGLHTNKFYYDHEDRLLGTESSKGISIGYQYDGNNNLLRQSVLSRTVETNGLPVLWLWLNGLTNQPGVAYANADADGWNNYQEWLAGTNPNNSNSVPSLLNNPGTNIATFSVPFTPTNWVMAAGQLNGVVGDEIVVGADGNATGKTNSLFILTQGVSSWQVQQLPVGAQGITSIAVGQTTNRPSPAIYIGLRQTVGPGAIWELLQTNGFWQTNVLAVSTSSSAFVLGVRGVDVLASFSTNGLDGALYSLACSNGLWSQIILNTNSSHRGLGTHGTVYSEVNKDGSIRLLDGGGIEVFAGIADYFKDGIQLPSSTVFNPATGKCHFSTTNAITFSASEAYFTNFHGNIVLPMTDAENTWVATNFPGEHWIGLYWAFCDQNGYGCGNFYPHYASGAFAPGGINTYSGYTKWGSMQPGNFYLIQPPCTTINNVNIGGSTYWAELPGYSTYYGIGEVLAPIVTYSNQWLIAEPPATSRFSSKGISLATGLPRPNQTNSTSVFYAFSDDQNLSGRLDSGDTFTLAEYVVSGNLWTTNTLVQIPITAGTVAQSYALAAVNFTGTGKDTVFTGEPDGRVYSWTGADATNSLQRQLFSDAYVSQAWQAMCGVQTAGIGKGLAGVLVSPTNQNSCNVIFWQPQATLPTPTPSVIETAPYAAVIPSNTTLGGNASVSVRLWHNQGNAATPFVQFQFLGSTNWQNATLTTLDGSPYYSTLRVAALPTGSTHLVVWNALGDIGANVVTNILLRASAQDFMLAGSWSQPTPFQLNTTVVSPPTNPPVNFTGISPVQGGIQFNWQGGSNAWLYLQRSPALAGTNMNWINIWTGTPPTPISGSYTDAIGTNATEFYRMKIVSP